MGYHKRKITKGEYGEFSKIREEFEEFIDANEGGYKVMELVELSDLVGAIDGFLKKHHPSIDMSDILAMSRKTQEAFEEGDRR
jgi:hypothetical protein